MLLRLFSFFIENSSGHFLGLLVMRPRHPEVVSTGNSHSGKGESVHLLHYAASFLEGDYSVAVGHFGSGGDSVIPDDVFCPYLRFSQFTPPSMY